MIEVQDLTKYYGQRAALKSVTFSVERGEVLGLLGPNAAGKTTTMRILTGFLAASSGTAKVAGYDVAEQPMEAKRHIGYLPENVPLYPEMTVRSYLEFVADLRGVRGMIKRASVGEAAEKARVTNVMDTLIGKLSRGYRQRVGLAQALLHRPDVVILDEPTVGLDPKQIIETRQVIKNLGGEHTVILSSHILPEVSMICGRVVIISDGKVVAVDTPANLTRRLQGASRVRVEVRGPRQAVVSALSRLPDVLAVESEDGSAADTVACTLECAAEAEARERVAAAIVNAGWGLLELRGQGMSLEDVFLRLTTTEEVNEA
ncbi:MAG: ABC transporter ATP-binding protein [Chloroflexota bacterium]